MSKVKYCRSCLSITDTTRRDAPTDLNVNVRAWNQNNKFQFRFRFRQSVFQFFRFFTRLEVSIIEHFNFNIFKLRCRFNLRVIVLIWAVDYSFSALIRKIDLNILILELDVHDRFLFNRWQKYFHILYLFTLMTSRIIFNSQQ